MPIPDQTARNILHQLASSQCTCDDYERLLDVCAKLDLHLDELLEDIVVRYAEVPTQEWLLNSAMQR